MLTPSRVLKNTHVDDSHRRQFLKQLSAVIGSSGIALVASPVALTHAEMYRKVSTNTTKVLSREQLALLAYVCSTVIPRTDTPSAADVDCHGFIDHQLYHCHDKTQQMKVKNFLATLNEVCELQHQMPFSDLSETLKQIMLEAVESEQGFSADAKWNFKFLKSLIVFGYFTSEAGATQALSYQAFPGGYKGSVKVTPSTKSWGSLNYY